MVVLAVPKPPSGQSDAAEEATGASGGEEDATDCCTVCGRPQAPGAAELLEYCLDGCLLCQHCALGSEIRGVLFDQDGRAFSGSGESEAASPAASPTSPVCFLCDQAKLLPGRDNLNDFDLLCAKVFAPPPEPVAEEISDCEGGDTESSSSSSSESEDQDQDQDQDDKPANDGSGPMSTADLNDAATTNLALSCDGEGAHVRAAGFQRESDFILPWSGGRVDIRTDDIAALFARFPVNGQVQREPFRGPTHGPFYKHAEFLRLRREHGRRVTPQRKFSLRTLHLEIDEVFGRWFAQNASKRAAGDPLVPLADSMAKYTFKQYGTRRMVDQYLLDFAFAVVQCASQSERVHTFGKITGIVDPELYTPLLSQSAFAVLAGCFASPQELQDVLRMGEAQAVVSLEKVRQTVQELFAHNAAWQIHVALSACEAKHVAKPWEPDSKHNALSDLDRLPRLTRARHRRPQSRRPTCNEDSTPCMVLFDPCFHFLISSWHAEWSGMCHRLDHADAVVRDRAAAEEARRARIISLADKRPPTKKEETVLRNMVATLCSSTFKVSEGKKLPARPEHRFWAAVAEHNKREQTAGRDSLLNRSVSGLCTLWHSMEERRIHRERLYWDFNTWPWEEEWEWGGLALAAPDEEDEGQEHQEHHQQQEQQGQEETSSEFIEARQATKSYAALPAEGRSESPEDLGNVRRTQSLALFGGSASLAGKESPPSLTKSASAKQLAPLVGLTRRDYCRRRTVRRPTRLAALAMEAGAEEAKRLINLGHYRGGAGGARALVAALECANQLGVGSLSLQDNGFSDEQGAAIVGALAAGHGVQELDFSRNRLGRLFATRLIERFQDGSLASLQHVILSGNKLGNEAATRLLGEVAKHGRVVHLDFGDNGLGGDGNELGNALAAAVESTGLETLLLGWNGLRCADVEPLFLALGKGRKTRLAHLGLPFNRLDDSITEALAKSLAANRSLQTLDLRYNGWTKTSAPALGKALGLNQCLERLRLSGNQLGEDGVNAVRIGAARALESGRLRIEVHSSGVVLIDRAAQHRAGGEPGPAAAACAIVEATRGTRFKLEIAPQTSK